MDKKSQFLTQSRITKQILKLFDQNNMPIDKMFEKREKKQKDSFVEIIGNELLIPIKLSKSTEKKIEIELKLIRN
jgi:hypothetical protein